MIFLPVSVEKAVVARLALAGKKFEILVDPEKALQKRRGMQVELEDLLALPTVYRDASKSLEASREELHQAFGTLELERIVEKILKKGEIQLTTEQRRKLVEQKKAQLANIISRKSINPQTKLPHPPQRILKAMEEAGVNVDPFEEAEEQLDKVVKQIQRLLPLSFEKVCLKLRIPSEFAGKAYGLLKQFGTLLQEKWLDDGRLEVKVELMAGLQTEFFEKLSKLTHGSFESERE